MISSDYTRSLFRTDSDTRIVLLVVDGLGGLPHSETGRSELETANLPHLDALCARGSSGLISPLGPGFTPGSGPAHLALFGYDPWTTVIGRGALSGLGLGLDFEPGDVKSLVLPHHHLSAVSRVSESDAGPDLSGGGEERREENP